MKQETSKTQSNHQDQQQSKSQVQGKPLEDEWLAISEDWQSQPYEKVDMQSLLAQTKRKMNYSKAILAFDFFGTLILIVAAIYGYFIEQWETPTIIYLAVAGLLSIVFVYYEVKIRLASWRLFDINPENVIENAIAGCQSSIQYIMLVKLSCYGLMPLMNWYLVEIISMQEKAIVKPLVIANSLLIGMYLIAHYYHVKRKNELTQLTSSLDR